MGDIGRPAGGIGIVVGLPREAAILKRVLGAATPPVVCAGADPARAAQGAAELIAGGADVLLSCGFAGGLDPALRPGDVVVASGVAAADGTRYQTHERLCQRVGEALDEQRSRWRAGLVAGADCTLSSIEAKRGVARQTSAIAVDMESHAVARAAAGRPFAVVRVIVDPAERAIPAAVLASIGADGRVRIGRLLSGALRRPRVVGDLWALTRDDREARASLRRVAAAIGALVDAVPADKRRY